MILYPPLVDYTCTPRKCLMNSSKKKKKKQVKKLKKRRKRRRRRKNYITSKNSMCVFLYGAITSEATERCVKISTGIPHFHIASECGGHFERFMSLVAAQFDFAFFFFYYSSYGHLFYLNKLFFEEKIIKKTRNPKRIHSKRENIKKTGESGAP